MRGLLFRLRRCRNGVSAAEFGMIAPTMIVLFAGLVDLAGAMQQAIRLESAARAGAQYAMSFPQDTAGIMVATAAAFGGSGATVAVVPAFCACPGDSTATVSCEGTPCGGRPSGVYVGVSITQPHAAIIGIGGYVLPSTLTGSAVARVR